MHIYEALPSTHSNITTQSIMTPHIKAQGGLQQGHMEF